MIREADARVVVFPELSLTGYELDAPAIAAQDPRLAAIIGACAATAIGGPGWRAGARRDRQACTSGCWPSMGPERPSSTERCGWAARSPSGSAQEARQPCSRSTSWRLGLAICKDSGIPAHAADTAALGIDAYVARGPGDVG